MIIYLYLALCSLACFWLITHKLPKREHIRPALLAGTAILYVTVRILFFDGKHPNETMVFFFFSIIAWLLYEISWRECLFNAAFCAYLLHAINTTHILPLPVSWMSGSGANWRLLFLGAIQILCAVLWGYFAADGSSNRLNRTVRYVVLIALVLENVHLIQAMFSEAVISPEQRNYLAWNFIEVEYIGLFLLFESYYAQRETVREQENMLQQQRMLWETKAEQNEEIRRMLHDLRHQISLIESMDTEASAALAAMLKKQMEDYLPLPDSGNIVIDAVLNEKLRVCKAENIRLKVEENVSSTAWIEAMDVSTIFGNAIENAIEAVRKLPEESRWIRLVIHETETFLMAKVENPYAGEIQWEGDRPVSTKQDAQNHGIGLDSIRKAVTWYSAYPGIRSSIHAGICTLEKMKNTRPVQRRYALHGPIQEREQITLRRSC